MIVRKTVEGDFIVANEYDGKRLHGPFKSEREAVLAMAPKAATVPSASTSAKPKKAKKKKKK